MNIKKVIVRGYNGEHTFNVEGNNQKEAEYAASGATMIDARQSIGKVVDDILGNISE